MRNWDIDTTSVSFTSNNKKIVNQFWIEKVVMIIDMFQIYGIIWNMSQSWGWPYFWSMSIRWIVWFNADFFSTTSDGALIGRSMSNISKWGQMSDYFFYALPFAVIPTSFVLSFFLIKKIQMSISFPLYILKWYDKRKDIMYSCLLFFLLMSYAPCSLAVARIFYCEHGNVSVDPNVQCFSSLHIIFLVIYAVCYAPIFLGLPYVLYKHIHTLAVYNSISDHEKKLQCYEISYMLGINQQYIRLQMWLMSSFTRRGLYYRFLMTMLKACLIILFVTCRFNLQLQSSLSCTLIAIAFMWCSWYQPYRHFTSNILLILLLTALLTGTIFGTINSYKVINYITVASTETILLFACHGLLGLAMACLFLYCIVQIYVFHSLRLFWPSYFTLQNISNSYLFPTILQWINTIHDAMYINEMCCVSNFANRDIPLLEHHIRRLRRYYVDATLVGSVFSMILSDVLDQLLITHCRYGKESLRSRSYFDKMYVNANSDNTFKVYDLKYKLMTKMKRKILLKLLALKVFNDMRKSSFLKSIQNSNIKERVNQMDHLITSDDNNQNKYITNKLVGLQTYIQDEKIMNEYYMKNTEKIKIIARNDYLDQDSDIEQNSNYDDDENDDDDDDGVDGNGTGVQSGVSAKLKRQRSKPLYAWLSLEFYELNLIAIRDLTLLTESLIKKYKKYKLSLASMSAHDQSHLQLQDTSGAPFTIQDFASLYEEWNGIIYKYESKKLPGGGLFNDSLVEEWYVYRNVLDKMYHELEAQVSEEEDEEEEDEDEEEVHEVNSLHSDILNQSFVSAITHQSKGRVGNEGKNDVGVLDTISRLQNIMNEESETEANDNTRYLDQTNIQSERGNASGGGGIVPRQVVARDMYEDPSSSEDNEDYIDEDDTTPLVNPNLY